MSNLFRTLSNMARGDIVLALGLVFLAVGEILLRDLAPRTPLLILAVLTPLPLVWRIRLPLAVLAASVLVLVVGELVAHRDGYPVALGCVGLVAAYSAAAHLRERRAETADFLVTAAIVGSAAVVASKN